MTEKQDQKPTILIVDDTPANVNLLEAILSPDYSYSAEEIIGKEILTIIPTDLHHERSHIWQTILSGEQLQYFETTRMRKDGKQIFVSISASPLLNTDGEPSVDEPARMKQPYESV